MTVGQRFTEKPRPARNRPLLLRLTMAASGHDAAEAKRTLDLRHSNASDLEVAARATFKGVEVACWSLKFYSQQTHF